MRSEGTLFILSIIIVICFLSAVFFPAMVSNHTSGFHEITANSLAKSNFFPQNSFSPASSIIQQYKTGDSSSAAQSAIKQVSVSGTSSSSLPRVISKFSVGTGTTGSAFDSAKNEIFLASGQAGVVSVVSLKYDSVVKNITDFGEPFTVIYDSGMGEIFVTNHNAGTVSVINDSTNKIVVNITVQKGPGSGAYDRSKGEVFILNDNSGTISVINDKSNLVVDTVSSNPEFGGDNAPSNVLYDSGAGEIIAPTGGGIAFINDTNNTVVRTVNIGYFYNGIVLDKNLGEVFIAVGDGNVDIVSVATANIISIIKYGSSNTGTVFAGIGFDSVMGDAYALINSIGSGWNENNVSIISDATNSIIGNFTAPLGGGDAVYDRQSGEMIIDGGNSISYVSVVTPLYLSVEKPSIDLGGTVTLSLATVKDAPPLAYSYSGLPPGAVSENKSSYSFTPTATGSYTIHGYANDSGGSAVSSASLTVNPQPSITSFTASPSAVNAGNSVMLNVSVSGGTAPFSYNYTGLPPGGSTANNSTIVFSPTAVGTYTVHVYVNDSSGGSTYATLTLNVNPGVVVPSITAQIYNVDVGQNILLNTSVNGGVSPYSYSYSASSAISGSVKSSTSQLSLKPTGTGSFTVTVKVTDAIGDVGTATTSIINVDPQMNVTLTVSNSTPLLGQTVAIVTSVTGGASPYSYSYSGLPPGAVSENKAAIGFLPTQSDYYNITVHVNDANNNNESSSVSLHVIFDFNVVVTSNVSAGSPFTISVNTNETFSGNTASGITTSGGIGILTYNYTGLPPGVKSQDSPTLKGTTDQPGTYHITVSVKDQAGDHRSHIVTLVVLPSSVTNLVKFFTGIYGIITIAAVIAVAIVSLLLVRRKRNAT